jgi:very-short-patch-repair endonuclease
VEGSVQAHRIVHELASEQLGLVTHEQLRRSGCSRDVIRGLLVRGSLLPVFRHVYGVAGTPNSHERTVLAAVLAAGEHAYASHATAAHLWGLCVSPPATIEVTTVYERCPRVDGVRLHRSGLLEDRDVCSLGSVPVARPERILVELSSRLSVRALGALADEALRRRLTTLGRIHATAARLRPAPGRSANKISQMLELRVAETEAHESVLEDFVYDAIRRFELPPPVAQRQVVVGGRRRRIDLCYPESWLALEAKGFEYHGRRGRFDDDALRGNELTLAGWKVLEFTSTFTDWQIAQQVAAALGREPPRYRQPRTFEEWKHLR